MRRNVHSSAVFTWGSPLCTQILPKQGRPPSTILGIKKNLRGIGLPDGEDRIPRAETLRDKTLSVGPKIIQMSGFGKR